MNNKLHPRELPKLKVPKAHDADNVIFSNTGRVYLSPIGVDIEHPGGNCTSLNSTPIGDFFVENDNLYLYKGQDTPIQLASNVGSGKFSFTQPIGNTVYFSNGTVRGRFVSGESSIREWAVPTPAKPTVTAIGSGGMDAGKYFVSIVWRGAKESSAPQSTEVTVAQGGGIRITNFPNNYPADVTKVGVLISQCNGESGLFRYGEYNISTTTLDLVKKNVTLKFENQYCLVPTPAADVPICEHKGRIYWADGNIVRFTHVSSKGPQYHLSIPFAYFAFDDTPPQVIVSDGVNLYVGTKQNIYRIGNIDVVGNGPPSRKTLTNYGAVKGTVHYADDGRVFFGTWQGIVEVAGGGIKELTSGDVAMPIYEYGSITSVRFGGARALVYVGKNGTQNEFADPDWNARYFSSDGAWALNLDTSAINRLSNLAVNDVSGNLASTTGGVGKLTPDVAGGFGKIKSGDFEFFQNVKSKIEHLMVACEPVGKLLITLTSSDGSVLKYYIEPSTTAVLKKIDPAKGSAGNLWSVSIESVSAAKASLMSVRGMAYSVNRF